MAKYNKNIIKNTKHYRFNSSIYIVLLIVAYLVIIVVSYVRQEHVSAYLVEPYVLEQSPNVTGIILRDELICNSENTGYINYYVQEGERAAADATVYTLDETGEFSKLLSQTLENNDETLNKEQWYDLKSRLCSLTTSYRDDEFGDFYSSKSKINSTLLDYMYDSAVSELTKSVDTSGYKLFKNDVSSVVLYHMDGFESTKSSGLSAESFDVSKYTSDYIKSGEMVVQGDKIYKQIISDNWTVNFLITDELREQIEMNKRDLLVYFPGIDKKMKLPFYTTVGADGSTIGVLSLDKYGMNYIKDRFINLKIVKDDIEGLAIPESAITTNAYYLIPDSFGEYGSDGSFGFYVCHPATGSLEPRFESVTLYGYENKNYYVSNSEINVGDYVVDMETEERYYIGPMENLTGVYNINQGYTFFRRIEIIAKTGDLCVVSPNVKYGINQYDYIALDASELKEHTLIN